MAPEVRPHRNDDKTPAESVKLAGEVKDPERADLGPAEDAALKWFLDDDEPEYQRTFTLNIGTDEAPRKILWTIRSLDVDTIRRLNRESEGNRANRRGGGAPDPDAASRRIVAAGTVSPDLAEIAAQKGIQPAHTDPLHAPMQVLAWRFRQKSGLIVQLANDVMGLSGYDEEDIQAVTAGKS